MRATLLLLLLGACSDEVRPVPAVIPHLNVPVPVGTTAYYAHDFFGALDESGVVRFDMPAEAVDAFARTLPCALSGVMDRASDDPYLRSRGPRWFTPATAARYRRFDWQCHKGSVYSELEIDVTDPRKATVYISWITGDEAPERPDGG